MSGHNRQRNVGAVAEQPNVVAGFPQKSSARSREMAPSSRERILDSAATLFASRGYDGVSTRELARSARVNLSAIGYHFGGKDKLYREVLTGSSPIRNRSFGQ